MNLPAVVHPMSGEVLDLESTTDTLAQWLLDLRELRQMLSGTIDTISEELSERLDQENTRTGRVGEWEIKGVAPSTTVYDPEQLQKALDELVLDGVLAAAVVERTVKPPLVKDWKVDRREIAKLLKHQDLRVREAVAACGEEVAQTRSVSIRRAA